MGDVRLNDSFTYFLYPFRITDDFLNVLGKNSIWKRSDIAPDPFFFFPHINSFFTGNISKSIEDIDQNQLLIYQIKSQSLTPAEKESLFLFKNLFGRNHSFAGKNDKIEFSFFKDNSVLSPTLFIIPLTRIGILAYGIQLGERFRTLDNLLELNYRLRIYSSGQVQDISTERNAHPNAKENEEKIHEKLTAESGNTNDQGSTYFSWRIPQWINYLLQGLIGHTSLLSPSRLQALVYLSLNDPLAGEELDIALFRLRRIYSNKYLPSASFTQNRSEISQTFEQVIYGATSEGAVVLVKNDEKEFLKNYKNTVIHRTLWSYFLAYHQRFAMIAAAADTNALYVDNREPTTQQLSDLIDRISKVQLKCLFSEISHYTQQNEFYYLAVKNLQVDLLFHEVKDEVEEMNKILTEKWREKDRLNKELTENESKKNQRKIEILLAMLILPQIWLALLSTNINSWQQFIDKNTLTINILSGFIWGSVIVVGLKLFFGKK